MKGRIVKRHLVAWMLVGAVTPSLAVTTGVMPKSDTGAGSARTSLHPEARKAMADDSVGLLQGTIESVDVAHGSFSVYGQRHTFNTATVRIFGRDGKPTTVHALRRGAPVRFLLEADDRSRRRVAVVYIDQ